MTYNGRQDITDVQIPWSSWNPILIWRVLSYRAFLTGRGHPMALVQANDGERDAMLVDKAPTKDDPFWAMRVWRSGHWHPMKIRTGQIKAFDSDRAQAGYE